MIRLKAALKSLSDDSNLMLVSLIVFYHVIFSLFII